MMNKGIRLGWLQYKIRKAIQRLHKTYYGDRYLFLTEADVQCTLYSELLKEISKKSKLISCDINGKKMKDCHPICTRQLHAEMYNRGRKSKEFVDLCIIDPNKFWLFVKKRKLNDHKSSLPIHGRDWDTKDSIGIEIKVNFWDSNLNRFCKSLIKDFKKLKQYKRGWLVFVDNYSLIKSKSQWKALVDKMIRDANMGKTKKTLNAYYLSPKFKKAFSYKSEGEAF